jgi:hypothetical protein
MNNQIIKGFGQGFKQLGEETVEKLGEEGQKILENTITGKELLGLEGGVSEEEIAKRKQEDEIHKQEEIRKIKEEMGRGRNVESEIEQISQEREQKEEEEEKLEERKEQQQREMERQEQMSDYVMMEAPKKHHKDKGGNKHKTQQPDSSQMSQTSEFKGKID